MIKTALLVCLFGLAASQYGHDGVRNRYFILGHGRGPVSTSLGSGIYGASLNTAPRSYAPAPRAYAPAPRTHSPAPRAYTPAPRAHAPAPRAYAAPAPRPYVPAPAAYAPVVDNSYSTLGAGHGGLASGYGAPSRSTYGHHDDLARPTPYEFGYDAHNEHGDEQSRHETGDGHGNVQGSYGYRDSYGIFRHVDYVADAHGFRANVRTNEPGTAPQNPADVHLQVEHGSGY